MKTNALNSTMNFGNSLEFRTKNSKERYQEDMKRAQELRKMSSEGDYTDANGLTLEEKFDIIDKAVAKANSNVHPSTIICSVAGMVGAGVAAMKFTTAGRKFVISLGESLHKALVNLSDSPEVSKKAQIDKIAKRAAILRDGNPKSKLVDNVYDFSKKVLNDDKADLIKEKMIKSGITNGAKAFDAGVGIATAAVIVDPASDALEQHTDKRDILKTVNALI